MQAANVMRGESDTHMVRILSIAVCTYNRAKSLRCTLDSIVRSIDLQDDSWELLVIDNNSSDNTREVVEEFGGRLPVRYLFEARQGLSHARNRALAECLTDLLLFTDDDMEVVPGWADGYLAAAQEFPDAGYFGGRILPAWPEGKPSWLHDEDLSLLNGVLGKYDLGGHIRAYRQGDPTPYGGNFGLRRQLFERLDGFRPDLGVSGTAPGRGEETEYFLRVLKEGFRGVYIGPSACMHRIRREQMSVRSLYHYGFQTAVSNVRMGARGRERGSYGAATSFGLRGIIQLMRGRGDRFRQCVINAGIQVGLRQSSGRR